jgi:hypothetical protein
MSRTTVRVIRQSAVIEVDSFGYTYPGAVS